jgi:hypothetical protein
VPGPIHGSEDLVGYEGEIAARDIDREIADALRPYGEGLESIEADLASVLATLRPAVPNGTNLTSGTPAAMVDTLVRTAADGIEDLAAGLMRANELAGVAERVTNRATLLALNAALEATRSGSESFASIAEETRRLAEYAREATDTISRLSSESEFKVGETIAAIQSTSEDAKAAVASMGSGAAPATGIAATPATVEAVEALLARARALRERMSAPVASPVAAPQGPTGGYGSDDAVAEAADEVATAWEPSARAPFEGPDAGAADAADEAAPAWEPSARADAGFELSPRYEPGPGGPAEPASEQADDEPRPIVVTIDAADEESSAEEERTATPAGEPEPERDREARNAPVLEPKIPDWLEGIRPGENQ